MTWIDRRLSARYLGAIVSVLGLSSGCGAGVDDVEAVSSEESALVRADSRTSASAAVAAPAAIATTALRARVGGTSQLSSAPTLAIATAVTSSSTRYFVLDVGALGGNPTLLHMNQTGGVIWNANAHAFLYRNCASRDLGSLAGGATQANAINNDDVVVGKSFKDGRFHAFSWSNGVMHDLGGTLNEEATAINFWGDVAGVESVDGTLAATGVRYVDGVVGAMARFLVNPPSGFANAPEVVAMNDSWVVVGTTTMGGQKIAAISFNFGALWQRIAGIPGFELNTLPAAINYAGHVVGTAQQGAVARAFLSRDPTSPAADLGTLPGGTFSSALGINRHDRVVGFADTNSAAGMVVVATLHDGTTMVDLNTRLWNPEGWLLTQATAIGDDGRIVGVGSLNNLPHGFILLPMSSSPLVPPCPPSTLIAD
jgi:probable HAF family extracellular repeat protein